MEKCEILDIMRGAIINVSPYAEDLVSNKREFQNLNVCFVDLGINSIDYAEIMLIVMDKLNLDFSLDIFTGTNRIIDAVNIVYDLKDTAI